MTDQDKLAEILSEGLDLCVRARKLDDPVKKLPVGHPENECDYPVMVCATPVIWAQDQYDTDLADWEKRARTMLVKLGYG